MELFHRHFIPFLLFLVLISTSLAFKLPTAHRASLALYSSANNELAQINADIVACKTVLMKGISKEETPENLIASLMDLEKKMRKRNTMDDCTTSRETLANLDGAWRLVFTTGTVGTQKKIGKINYFPIKAVQSFDSENMLINNGIYLGDFAIIKFFGEFQWKVKARKVEFDFDKIKVFGFEFDLKKGEAASLGATSGLGSEGNVENAKRNKSAFFNWIFSDQDIACARGGGGGLAIWKRDRDMEERNRAEGIAAFGK